jgi:hypothetical protein
MQRFCEFCTKVKVVATEMATLVGFLGIVACGIYFEYHVMCALMQK